MKGSQHIVAAALAGILLLFSVGLPVVVASCPMMAASSGKAPCCAHRSQGLSLHAPAGFDCCRTVLAAERNVNGFVVAAQISPAPLPAGAFTPAVESALLPLPAPVDAAPAPDIPIRCSSLLI